MSKVVLEINDSLSAGETATVSDTPVDGKQVTVLSYFAEIPQSEEVSSSILWGGNTVWNIRESGKMPFDGVFTGDGVKKLELMIENINSVSPQSVSARVVLDVRDV